MLSSDLDICHQLHINYYQYCRYCYTQCYQQTLTLATNFILTTITIADTATHNVISRPWHLPPTSY